MIRSIASVTSSKRFLVSSGLLLGGLVALGVLVSPALSDPAGPGAEDRQIARRVAALLERQHVLMHPVDDEMSQRCLKSFIEKLDLWKIYFYQSDVDEFQKHRNELDDLIQGGDVKFAHEVFDVFLDRVDERLKMIEALLDVEHDFKVDEQILSDRDMAHYPKTPAEAQERWRKRIKYDLLLLKVDEIDGEEAREKLRRRYTSFAKRMHQFDREDLLEMYLSSMTGGFDPHTSYMSAATLENFAIMMRLELDGIGAELKSDDGYTTVNKVVRGGAADKDGRLKVEDKIVAVRSAPDAEMVDIVDMKLSDVVKMIRGTRGTKVELEIVPGDGSKRKAIVITRARIELKDKEAQSAVFERGRKANGKPYKLGVIYLPSFYMDMAAAGRHDPNYKSTTRDVRRILEQFNADGVDALLLDLRHNGGGSLTEAIQCTGLFVDTGPIVQVKDAAGRITAFRDPEPGVVWKRPLIVMTSKFSASASEILAGAIQDYHRGLIVGDPSTHGKGTVQTLIEIGQKLFQIQESPELGALKITTSQFYRPSGDSTQARGVEADIRLPSLTAHYADIGEADLDYALEFDRIKPSEFDRFSYVNAAVVDQLSRLSQMRCEQSEDFAKELNKIARYKEQKAKKFITLNEKEFLAERAELNADKEEEKAIEELDDGPAIVANYYLDETMAIMLDFLRLRQVAVAR